MASTAYPTPEDDRLDTEKHRRLEEFERSDSRPPFILTYTELKLLGIAGVRIFHRLKDLNLNDSDYLSIFRSVSSLMVSSLVSALPRKGQKC